MLIPHPHYLQKGPLDLIETGKGLKVQTDKPHLVSLGSGRLSTAITLLPLEEGRSWGAPCHPSVLTDIPAPDSRHMVGTFCPLSATFASPRCGAVPPHSTSLLALFRPPWTAWPSSVDNLAP